MSSVLDILRYVLETIDVSKPVVDHLIKKRITSVLKLYALDSERLQVLRNDAHDILQLADMENIKVFQAWMKVYLDEHQKFPTEWEKDFTADIFEGFYLSYLNRSDQKIPADDIPPPSETDRSTSTFGSFSPSPLRPNNLRVGGTIKEEDTIHPSPQQVRLGTPVSPMDVADSREVSSKIGQQSNVKWDIKAYPPFDGKISKWRDFKDKFIAVATSQQLEELLEADYALPVLTVDIKTHQQANRFLYSALLFACAGGTAKSRVKQFSATKDGRLAYMCNQQWYEGQGSLETLATRAMESITTIQLTRDSYGGADTYITKFDDLLTELAETGNPYSATMKKVTFLRGIKDPAYGNTIAVLKADPQKTYHECLLEIQKESIDYEDARPTRAVFRKVRAVGTEQEEVCTEEYIDVLAGEPDFREVNSTNTEADAALRRIPTEMWNSWSETQKIAWRAHVRNTKNKFPVNQQGPHPKQELLPRQYGSNERVVRAVSTAFEVRGADPPIQETVETAPEPSTDPRESHPPSFTETGESGGNPASSESGEPSKKNDSDDGSEGSEGSEASDDYPLTDIFARVNHLGLTSTCRINMTESFAGGARDSERFWVNERGEEWTLPPRPTVSENPDRLVDGIPINKIHENNNSCKNGQSSGLIDGGADTNVLGEGWLITHTTQRVAHIKGFDLYKRWDIPIATGVTAYDYPDGRTILLRAHESLSIPNNNVTILSSSQLRENGIKVDDVARRHGGKQAMVVDDITIPLEYKNALCYCKFRMPSKYELDTLVPYDLTSDQLWNPKAVGENLPYHLGIFGDSTAEIGTEDEEDTTAAKNNSSPTTTTTTTAAVATVEHTKNTVADTYSKARTYGVESISSDAMSRLVQDVRAAYLLQAGSPTPSEEDVDALRPFLGWVNADIVRRTLQCTTRLAKLENRLPMRRHIKARFPQLNHRRLAEKYATDTFFATTKSIEGYKAAQIYVGKTSQHVATYGLRTESQGPDTLQDFIRDIGAPYHLHNDNARMETGHAWTKLLRTYNIKSSTTEPHHPHQNTAERYIQTVKDGSKRILDRAGAPDELWYKAIEYYVYIHNRLAQEKLQWKSSLERSLGDTPDISALLEFTFYQRVLYSVPDESFPLTTEKEGRFIGIAPNCGDAFTFYILTADNKILCRSVVRPLDEDSDRNLRAEAIAESLPDDTDSGEIKDTTVIPLLVSLGEATEAATLPDVDPAEYDHTLLGTKFVRDLRGVPTKATVQAIRPTGEVKISYIHGMEDIISYEELITALNKPNEDGHNVWTYTGFKQHRGTGSKIELLVQWDNGDETWEPLSTLRKDDPISMACYARQHKLQDTRGWKWAKKYRTVTKRYINLLSRLVNNAQQQQSTGMQYKFGIRVPRSVREAYELDKANGNTKWADAIAKELAEIKQYSVFKELKHGMQAPKDYRKIPYNIVFDVKFDLRHKARLVAGGHRTAPPAGDIFSGVVSIDSVRLSLFLGVLNNLQCCAGDVGNAFLCGKTTEQYYVIAGPEFGELEGCVLIIVQSLYGLKTSAARWHEFLSETLRRLGFYPSKADTDIRMKDCGTHYEYCCVYVDDVIFIGKNPMYYINQMKYEYNMKGVGRPEYYLGGDVIFGTDDAMSWSAKTYIKNVTDRIEKLFETTLREWHSPACDTYHPEVDDSPFLAGSEIPKYQMLIGSLNWVVTLGRFDVHYVTSSLARFSQLPREGHLMAALRVFGYLKAYMKAKIDVDTTEPTIPPISDTELEWSEFYPGAYDELPPDMPPPKGKSVVLTTWVDADHASDLETRRSVTGVLIYVNQTPIRWYSKRQNTVETSTFGSELVAARIAAELTLEMRYKLRMLGVHVESPTIMYGDNQSVVTNTTIPSSPLKKKHNAIAYHMIRCCHAAGILRFLYTPTDLNRSDMLTKGLSPKKFIPIMKPIFMRRKQLESSDENTEEGDKNKKTPNSIE